MSNLLRIAGKNPLGNAQPFSVTETGDVKVKESAEMIALIEGLEGKDFSTEETLAAAKAVLDSILAKIIAAPATEATAAAAKLVLDAIAGKDFATQTTSAAILAKLSDLATAAKQDSAKAVLDSIAAEDFATSAKQDVAKGVLDTIAGKDFATQDTLAAVLAKLADPATQTTLNALKTLFDNGSAKVQLNGSILEHLWLSTDVAPVLAADARAFGIEMDVVTHSMTTYYWTGSAWQGVV